MGKNRNWTKEERQYLEDNWGRVSVPTLCKNLNRSEHAIAIKVYRWGLGRFTEGDDLVSFNQILVAMTGSKTNAPKSYEWYFDRLTRKGLKIINKRRNKVTVRMVKLEDFWKFAESHRKMFDFSKLERCALGKEPDWVEEQRRIDEIAHIGNATQSKWTPYELSQLEFYAKQNKYTVNELSKLIGRSEGAVARKCRDLGYSPFVRNKAKHYSAEELDYTTNAIIRGEHYATIAKSLGRSEKSLRGIIYQRLGTEHPDKVRELLKSGATLPVKERINKHE